jgi:hypothetical protein
VADNQILGPSGHDCASASRQHRKESKAKKTMLLHHIQPTTYVFTYHWGENWVLSQLRHVEEDGISTMVSKSVSLPLQDVYIAILLPENNNDFLNNFIFSHTCFQATGDTSKPLYTSYRRNQSIIRSCTCVLFLSRTVAMTFKNDWDRVQDIRDLSNSVSNLISNSISNEHLAPHSRHAENRRSARVSNEMT